MRVGPKEQKPAKKKANAKSNRKAAPKAAKPVTEKATPAEPKKGGEQARIDAHFNAYPGQEFSPAELSAALNMRVQTAALMCSKFAHQGKLEKTASGKFRTAKVHAMPKTA
jgi:hypothetical protein